MSRGKTSTVFNITEMTLQVMNCILAGINHHRDIADELRVPEKNCHRVISRLADAGMIKIVPKRVTGSHGGMGLRIYHYEPTEIGALMISLCKKIEAHRRRRARKLESKK